MTRLELDVLAAVVEAPASPCRMLAEQVLGTGRAGSQERLRVSAALRNLVSLGAVTVTLRPRAGAQVPCHLYWPVEGFEEVPNLVHLTHNQRHLIRHLLRTGLASGQLGPPSEALLHHLEAEESRLARPPATYPRTAEAISLEWTESLTGSVRFVCPRCGEARLAACEGGQASLAIALVGGRLSIAHAATGKSALADVSFPATAEGFDLAKSTRDRLLVCGVDWSGSDAAAIQSQVLPPGAGARWREIRDDVVLVLERGPR